MVKFREFRPDWISPPGNTIEDLLHERKVSTVDFARQVGCSLSEVQNLLSGNAVITATIARQLQNILGGSADFWVARESQYRCDLIRIEQQWNETIARWLNEVPIKDMTRFGWIESVQDLKSRAAICLEFFNVPDVSTWREHYRNILETAAFRTSPSFDSIPGSVAAWLRKGEIDAERIKCKPWDSEKLKTSVFEIRNLTRKKSPNIFIPELISRCAECGVAAVIVRAPSGCRASGATQFLNPKKALLLLSFRYLSDDHFWFTFFHEVGHLLLHGKNALFLEGAGKVSEEQENEANDFSASVLVPPDCVTEMLNLPAERLQIIKFARKIGVSPGIVVGQLQHYGRIERHQLNDLKRRFTWTSNPTNPGME